MTTRAEHTTPRRHSAGARTRARAARSTHNATRQCVATRISRAYHASSLNGQGPRPRPRAQQGELANSDDFIELSETERHVIVLEGLLNLLVGRAALRAV